MFTAASDTETVDEVVAKAHIRKENIQRIQIVGDNFGLALPIIGVPSTLRCFICIL
jgi:hypothetical protein